MEDRKNHSGGFGNGFIFGLFLGVILTLLFTTKRGKRIVKALTEEGKGNMSNLKQYLHKVDKMVEDDVELEEFLEEEEMPQNGEEPPVKPSHHAHHHDHEHEHDHKEEKPHSKPHEKGVHRFFKRPHKKS